MPDTSRELFEQLYTDNYIKVYRLALGLTGNQHDAEEITQEAFCRAFQAYNTFHGDCVFFTWIYRITLNVANNYLKQRTKLRIYELTEDLGYSLDQIIDLNPANDPETEVLCREVKFKCLQFFMECLPLKQRKVLCMAFIVGLPYKLIAEIMNCSISSVKTTLHRGKKQIAGYLEERCQLVKKSNPCTCNQWVRRGLQQGWLTKQNLANPRPSIVIQAEKDVVKLRYLRYTYQSLYPETIDESLAQRIHKGIQNKEWTIFS
ncbi:MAG: polymerase sigma factor, sigma-70 family [Firmicutes bacterium]|nr:polymerase sigma factor, sigma-70 family [Bacillota bacterium]